jgi:V/A-type H+-transporting ATPase subunit G/H
MYVLPYEKETKQSLLSFHISRNTMTKAEILYEIKAAEEEAKASVARAFEAKNKKISETQVQSRDIIRKAEEEAQETAASKIGEIKKQINEEREKIIKKGAEEALEIKTRAKKNVTKATKYILTEFERAADA